MVKEKPILENDVSNILTDTSAEAGSLIYVLTTLNFISAVSALTAVHGDKKPNVTVLVHSPGLSIEANGELTSICKEFSKNFPFIKNVLNISREKKAELLSTGDIDLAVNSLKNFIGEDIFAEIYYPHDIEGGMYQFLCTSYPGITKICFGDALGNVYDKEYHLMLASGKKAGVQERKSIVEKLKSCFMSFLSRLISFLSRQRGKAITETRPIVFEEFKAQQAVLILPIAQKNNYFENIPLKICPRNIFLTVLEKCADSAEELNKYISVLLDEYKGADKYLLLLENIASGNFMPFEREVEMYCAVIKKYCAKGSTIFIKSHPLETLPTAQRIKESLSADFNIIDMDCRFERYPVEVWKKLVTNCKVISMSYPALSLKFLFDIDVIHFMSNKWIEEWFEERFWDSYKNSMERIVMPLKNLENWDGKSVLWSGNS